MKVIILLVCLFVAVKAHSAHQQEFLEWQQFKARHGKSYENDEEDQHRMKIFLDNKAFVAAHNKRHANGEISFTVALNMFADLTNQEFNAMYMSNMTRRITTDSHKPKHPAVPIHDPPASWDWRNFGVVTPVKYQAQCGSGYAFSATGSIEAQYKFRTGNLLSFSEQQIVDCSPGNLGCYGGTVFQSFNYIMNYYGIETEDTYPYTGQQGTCNASPSFVAATISGFNVLTSADEDSLTSAIASAGPISVLIDASHQSFQLYQSGVYYEPYCSSTVLDHGVLAVGYGYDAQSGLDYYSVKNSWGLNWGVDGYIYMARNEDNMCGIATDAMYPQVP